ncbi:testis-expressed protein 47-like isoform X2 [Littorina saxatilis]|uniref:BLUF domain-containing protein n=1 Tax=Littorina saxatilis TaxID=31220 RepID=A0AAN9GLB2_9CAEN
MAMEDDDNEDTLLDIHRTSLLEVIEDRNRTLNKKNLIHRVFVLSKIEEGVSNRTEVGNRFDSFLKRMKNDYQTEPITGLMLIYMKHIVHVMECSADMITELARELVSLEEDHEIESLLAKSKILVISHDIPQRQYQGWCFRTLDIVEPGLEAYEATDTTENLTVDLLSQLLRLGSFLAKQPKLNLKSTMDSLHDKVPELLPQQAIVHFLLEDNDPCIMTPQEYVNIHDRPFDITLDSDLVWPLPTRLFPYN